MAFRFDDSSNIREKGNMNMSKTAMLLCVLGLFSAFAGDYETVVDDSVVGYWRLRTGRGGE